MVRVLALEDGNLATSIVTSRQRLYKDLDLTFSAKSGSFVGVENISAADVDRVAGTYYPNATGGSGTGAQFQVVIDSTGFATVRVIKPGTGYRSKETLTISADDIGGSGEDLTFDVLIQGDIFKKNDAAAVKQAVKNLLLTNYYEKPFLPKFGGDLRSMLFELADDETANDIEDRIISAISTYEPRARVLNVIADVQPDYNSVKVTVNFQVINTEELVTFTTVLERLR